MIHTKTLGIEPEVLESESQGWWVNGESEWDPFGFEVSIFFPGWPQGLLPAVSVQLWGHRIQIGWFL